MQKKLNKQLKVAPKRNENTPKIAPKSKIVNATNDEELFIGKEDMQNNKELAPINGKEVEVKLWLDSVPHTRKSLSRIIRMVGHNEYPIDKAGKMCYLIQTLLMAFKTEADLSYENDIEEIKQMLKESMKHDKD